MKVAVTSASGQLGTAVVNQLKTEIGEENCIGVARTPEKAKHLGVEIRKGDYSSKSDFLSALKGTDAVLIISGNAAPEDRIGQHRNIIEAAKEVGVKKIVYTSIVGQKGDFAFSPIIESNRLTEEDVKASGLDWAIGRNGLYIEPDFEYVKHYEKDGFISNCAEAGLCAYTSRKELAVAYARMLTEEKHNGQVYNLVGHPVSQLVLADVINRKFGKSLYYKPMSVEDYEKERTEALGPFLGKVIAGIYHGIQLGFFNPPSDFEKATGRQHISPDEMAEVFKN